MAQLLNLSSHMLMLHTQDLLDQRIIEYESFKPCLSSPQEPPTSGIESKPEANKRPTSLPHGPVTPILTNTEATPLTTPSSYATPVAPTPVAPIFSAEGLAYSTYTVTPIPFNSQIPITSPLPTMQISTPTSNR